MVEYVEDYLTLFENPPKLESIKKFLTNNQECEEDLRLYQLETEKR